MKKSRDSDQVFRVVEVDDTAALIEPTDETAEAPGGYPHWWGLAHLIPAGD